MQGGGSTRVVSTREIARKVQGLCSKLLLLCTTQVTIPFKESGLLGVLKGVPSIRGVGGGPPTMAGGQSGGCIPGTGSSGSERECRSSCWPALAGWEWQAGVCQRKKREKEQTQRNKKPWLSSGYAETLESLQTCGIGKESVQGSVHLEGWQTPFWQGSR